VQHDAVHRHDYPRPVIDPALIRPAEVDLVIGDPSKAKKMLGWEPTVSFEQLIEMMVEADIKRLKKALA
jgi:GDPmannose 4,6-dehydratase